MYPHDLIPERLKIPAGERHSAVLFTGGTGLRFLRFGFRIQQAFPGMVRKWYVHAPPPSVRSISSSRQAREIVNAVRHRDREALLAALQKARNRIVGDPLGDRQAAERAMFEDEVRELRAFAEVMPEPVADPNAPDVVAEIKEQIRPYLMLSLGGPLYRTALLESVRGLALNQHAGWSPDLRGSNTILRAFYHRRTDWLGSTVHLHATGADSGPILRRSTATVMNNDTPAEVFLRVVALGTELMIEAVSEILAGDEITVFPQPSYGHTITKIDQSRHVDQAVARDLKSGWLAQALARERVY